MKTTTQREESAMELQTQIAVPQQSLASAQQEDNTLMNLIAKMASDPQADVPKLERLIALRNDEMSRRAKSAYDADFVKMKPELPLVIRTHDNAQTKSKFAKIEDINRVIDPVLSKFGFGTTSKVIAQTETGVTMKLEVRHHGGHAEIMELTMPLDDRGIAGTVNKTKIHAISATITYIKRVGFCALLNISTGDDKDGNTQLETISFEQAAEIDLRIAEMDKISAGYRGRFLKWAKVASAKDIPTKNYKECFNAIKTAEAEIKKTSVKPDTQKDRAP